MAEPSPISVPQDAAPEPSIVNGDAAAHNEDVPMQDSSAVNDQLPTEAAPVVMPEIQPPTPAQPAQPQAEAQAATPTPAPAPTPAAPSSRNSPHPAPQAPSQPVSHGSPTRVYLNTNVTPHLLEAMKHLATTEPDKPLKWLSEYLAAKSLEIEGP